MILRRQSVQKIALDESGIAAAKQLDGFALLASQAYNYGNSANWVFSFRVGYQGVMSRVYGLGQHSASLHNWSVSATITSHEHDVAAMLFCMDSAIECFVFMLNALGHAVDRSGFRDISSDRDLRRISPDDILGANKPERAGYARLFPELQSHWKNKNDLIQLIFENHDVTKHRHQALVGGKYRLDPPEGFYESLGIPNDPIVQGILGPTPPMEYVNIPTRPKLPVDQRAPTPSEWTPLESVEKDFNLFLSASFSSALRDVHQTIALNESQLRR